MREVGSFLAALLAAYLGFGLIAVAMSRHWRQAMGPAAAVETGPAAHASVGLRVTGGVMLGASLAFVLYGSGPSFGAVLWVILLSLSAYSVVATLTFRPAWLRPLARLCAALGG